MKKNFLLLGFLILSVIFISACDSNDDEKSDSEFSEATIEENKTVVENVGLSVTGDLKDIEDEEATKISEYFGELLSSFGGEDNDGISINPISALAEFGKTENLDQLVSGLKEGEEDGSIEDLFEDKGTYAYNQTTGEWDFTAGGNVVIFEFPASEIAPQNNASVTISKFEFTDDEMPSEIELEMKKEGTVIMSFYVSVSFPAGEEIPNSISLELELTNYRLVIIESLVNNATFSSELSISKGENELIDINLNGEGNFSNIADQEDPFEVIDTVSFRITFNDQIYVKAEANTEAIAAGELTISNKYDALPYTHANELARENEMVALVNSNTNMSLYLSSGDKIIANMEFYVIEEYDYVDVGVNMVFDDESKVDSETYFNTIVEDITQNIIGV